MNKTNTTTAAINFLAVAPYGWGYSTSPAQAIAKVQDFTFYDKRPRKGSDKWKKAQAAIQLWMVRADEWVGTNNYRPIDKDGNNVGILLHGYHSPDQHLQTYDLMAKAARS
jgi:hypothetical protein